MKSISAAAETRFDKGLKRKIEVETGFLWKPHLYVGCSFRKRPTDLDVNEMECKAIDWSNRLAERSKGHVVMDSHWGYDPQTKRHHFHGVIIAEKPDAMTVRMSKSLWKEGNGCFRLYNKEEGGVIYNLAGHEDMYTINRVACPHSKGSCRRNKCYFQADPSRARTSHEEK